MSNTTPNVDDLLERLRHGESVALGQLLDHYRPRLQRLISMRMSDRLAARLDTSDVVQEVFLDADRQLASYLQESPVEFYIWLRGLACQRLSNLQRFHGTAQRRSVGREIRLPAKSSADLLRHLAVADPSPGRAMVTSDAATQW